MGSRIDFMDAVVIRLSGIAGRSGAGASRCDEELDVGLGFHQYHRAFGDAIRSGAVEGNDIARRDLRTTLAVPRIPVEAP